MTQVDPKSNDKCPYKETEEKDQKEKAMEDGSRGWARQGRLLTWSICKECGVAGGVTSDIWPPEL